MVDLLICYVNTKLSINRKIWCQMASQYTNVFCNIMPLWIKYKYTDCLCRKLAIYISPAFQMNIFIQMVIVLGKISDINIFIAKNKYGFEFTKTPFHTQGSFQFHAKCLVFGDFHRWFDSSIQVWALPRKPPQTELFYFRDRLCILISKS